MIRSEDILKLEVPFPDIKEIRRYAECESGADDIIFSLLNEISDFSYKVRYKIFDINADGNMLDLGFTKLSSEHLAKNLKDCEKIILFAATLGMAPDKLIAKYSAISPAKALILQAICTERIEALCDTFCSFIKNEAAKSGFSTRPRFSAGYGDLPLTLQKDIFSSLDCERKIGITLTKDMLMIPTKSVTAIIGLKASDQRR